MTVTFDFSPTHDFFDHKPIIPSPLLPFGTLAETKRRDLRRDRAFVLHKIVYALRALAMAMTASCILVSGRIFRDSPLLSNASSPNYWNFPLHRYLTPRFGCEKNFLYR